MTIDEFRMIWGEPPQWLERFLEKTVRLPADPDQEVGCLWWVGAQSRGGQRPGGTPYGSFHINARLKGVRSHIAVATAVGLIKDFRCPEGMHVDHECNRTLCVDPRHFVLKPGLENIKARWQRPARPLNEDQEAVIRYRGVGGRNG